MIPPRFTAKMFRAAALLLASAQALHISKGTWHNYPSVDAKAIDARDARRERSERLDAESRGLVTDLRDHVRPVLDAMTNSPALKYDIEAVKKASEVEGAEARAVEAALHATTLKNQQGAAWEPVAWKDATDETSRRLAKLYEDGLATVKKRAEMASKLQSYQARQRIVNLYQEGLDRIKERHLKKYLHHHYLLDQEKQAKRDAATREALVGEIHGSWQLDTGDANPRVVELLEDGKVEIKTDRGEYGTWSIEQIRGSAASIAVHLFMTPAPSLRCKEHVFKGVVKDDFAVATETSAALWVMKKL